MNSNYIILKMIAISDKEIAFLFISVDYVP